MKEKLLMICLMKSRMSTMNPCDGMKCFILATYMALCILTGNDATAQHRAFDVDTSLTWQSCIEGYRQLDLKSEFATLTEAGKTDIGKPLHLFIINKDKVFYPELFDRKKVVLFINNGIHPGEPDGIDASLIWCRELLDPNNVLNQLLDSVIVCVIPVYNVDGCLNRSDNSRVNQDGPKEYGFRGNARNLDLNRDFIKCDSENAKSFAKIFRRLKPTVFVDTHVSNGADYPYTMTLISTQSDKLGGTAGNYLREQMTPSLFAEMKNKGWEMCPYVNTMGRTPESGLVEFLESPRFASGYAALFNTLGFITETHMLKPFAQRTESTYQFLVTLMEYCDNNAKELVKVKKVADLEMIERSNFPVNWSTDTTLHREIEFSGFEAVETNSEINNGKRTYYDHDKPWQKQIRYYDRCQASCQVRAPRYYLIPQAWKEVILRLELNGVLMQRIKNDTMVEVEVSYIEDLHTHSDPYEGHYPHDKVQIRNETQLLQFYSGDYLIPLQQEARRYLIETLDPRGEDSFFAWNYFDSCLQQKEWFSDYVFEDKAAALIKDHPELVAQLEDAMKQDEDLASSHWLQLYWIYKHSPYYEKSAFRYPVYRIEHRQ